MLCPALLLALSQSVGEAPPIPSAPATTELRGEALELTGPLVDALSAYRARLSSPELSPREALRVQARCAHVELLLGQVSAAKEELECLLLACTDPSLGPLRAAILGDLAEVHLLGGRTEEALACSEEGLARARLGESPEEECRALCRIARARTRTGDIARAEDTLHRALDAARASDAPGIAAEVWRDYGLHDLLRGKLREAYEHLHKALEFEPIPIVRVQILGDMGNVLAAMQRTAEARRCFEDSLQTVRTLGIGSYASKYMHGFGNLEMTEGNLDVAIGLFEGARASLGEDASSIDAAEILLSLSQARLLRRGTDDVGKAATDAQAVLDIGTKLDDLRLLVNAAILLHDAASVSAALVPGGSEAASRRLRDLSARAQASPDLELAAKSAGILAWDAYLRGQFVEAIRGGNQAYGGFADLGDDQQCLLALDTVAVAALRKSDVEELSRALERAELILDRGESAGDEDRSRLDLRPFFGTFEAYGHDLVALKLGDGSLGPQALERIREAGFETAGSWKARSLVESLVRRRLGASVPEGEELRAARTAHAEARQRLEAVAHDHGPRAMLDEVHLETVRQRRRVEDLERAARARLEAGYPNLLPSGKPSTAVRAVLPAEGTALVEFVAGTRRLYAYLLTRGGFDFVTLGERAPIERDARSFVSLIATNTLPDGAQPGPAGSAGIAHLGASLYSSLLREPLLRLGPSIRSLVIVPTSELADLPFDALVEKELPSMDAGSSPVRFVDLPFLVRRISIVYVPSSPALVELSTSRPADRKPTMLLFADPTYARAPSGGADVARSGAPDPLGGIELESLTHTRIEVARIAGLMAGWTQPPRADDAIAIQQVQSGRCDHHRSVDGYELCLGPEATPDAFCRLAGSFRILHVAAHGLRSAPGSIDPLLALTSKDGRSGLLTCGRILGLTLDADLVVLAACDTASGRKIDGEGLRSLAHAFLHAGARSVISSLWETRDLETSELMATFYTKLLREGLQASEALRAVKLSLLQGSSGRGVSPNARLAEDARFVDSSDPYFWAGFVYCGSPR